MASNKNTLASESTLFKDGPPPTRKIRELFLAELDGKDKNTRYERRLVRDELSSMLDELSPAVCILPGKGNPLLHNSSFTSSSFNEIESDLSRTSPVAPVLGQCRAQLIEVTIGRQSSNGREIRLAGDVYLGDDDIVSVSSDISCDDKLEWRFFERENMREEVCCDDTHNTLYLGTSAACKSKRTVRLVPAAVLASVSSQNIDSDDEESCHA